MKERNKENLIENLIKIEGELISTLLDDLKDELKKKAVFISEERGFPQEKIGNNSSMTRAQTEYLTSPPLIRFFLEAIAISHLQHMKQDIKNILSHELIHSFGIHDEETPSQKETKVNFFK